MVRLHMLHYKIVRLPAAKRGVKVVKPFLCKMSVHRVHNGNMLVHYSIGVVAHSVRDYVLAFKQVNIMVVHADIDYIVGDVQHIFSS